MDPNYLNGEVTKSDDDDDDSYVRIGFLCGERKVIIFILEDKQCYQLCPYQDTITLKRAFNRSGLVYEIADLTVFSNFYLKVTEVRSKV